MIKGKKMSIYELRIYTLYVGKINEAKEIYQNHGWPAIKKYEEYLIKYFIGDVGALNQIIHIWKFNDDEWKVHVKDTNILEKLSDTFGLDSSTIYYENGRLSEETAWDVVVPNSKIKEVKKFLKDNT